MSEEGARPSVPDGVDLARVLSLVESPVLVIGVDADEPAPIVVYANHAAARRFDLEGRGLSEEGLGKIVSPGAKGVAALARSIADGAAFEGEATLRAADGGDFLARLRGASIGASVGRSNRRRRWYGLVLLDAEIGAGLGHGLAERQIAFDVGQSDAVYRERAQSGGRFVLRGGNALFERWLGWSMDSVAAASVGLDDLVDPSEAAGLRRRRQDLRAGVASRRRFRIVGPNGVTQIFEDYALPEFDANGVLKAVVGRLRPMDDAPDERSALRRICAWFGGGAAALDASGVILWCEGDAPWAAVARDLRPNEGLPLEEAERWRRGVEFARLAGRPVEMRLRREDGAIAPVSIGPDGEGGLLCLFGPIEPPGDAARRLAHRDAQRNAETVNPLVRDAKRAEARERAEDDLRRAALAILGALGSPAALLDARGVALALNEETARLAGVTLGQAVGAPLIERLAPAGAAAGLEAALTRAARGETAHWGDGRMHPRWILQRLEPQDGPLGSAILALADPKALDPATARAARPGVDTLDGARAILDSLSDAFLAIDREGRVRWASAGAARLFDLEPEKLAHARVDELIDADADASALIDDLSRADRLGDVRELDGVRAGARFSLDVVVNPLRLANGRIALLTLRDATKHRQTEEALRHIAYTDLLTELPNRHLFADRVEQAIARCKRAHQQLAVMLVDLDRFKLVNDSLGHQIGDAVLRAVAERLVQSLRKSDTVARLSGDEFMILLPAADSADVAARVAQKALDSLTPPFEIEGHEFSIGGSIGIALYPHDGRDADALIRNADSALSRAKAQGGKAFMFYTNDMNAAAFERLMLENRLRRAVERRELELHYQPIVELERRGIVGVEALVRWRHPELGMVPPGQFVPLAEETGLINAIGDWVVREAAAAVVAWRKKYAPALKMSVNISSRQFQERGLIENIRKVVEAAGAPPGAIELELTESVVMRDPEGAATRLAELAALGVPLAIDDFGTGYSSLSYLKRFPITRLKIDRSFVADVTVDPNDAAIASAVIALAGKLGLEVTAEGVETEDQLAWLAAEGCAFVQGFLFSKPVPRSQMEKLLKRGRL